MCRSVDLRAQSNSHNSTLQQAQTVRSPATPGAAKITGTGEMMAKPKKRIEHDWVVTEFADRLREARISRGLTQADLATKAEVSVAYVGRLERGLAAPGIDLLARLAQALGCPAGELLPSVETTDSTAVLREQAKKLFDALVRKDDTTTLKLLTQLLAHLSEVTSTR